MQKVFYWLFFCLFLFSNNLLSAYEKEIEKAVIANSADAAGEKQKKDLGFMALSIGWGDSTLDENERKELRQYAVEAFGEEYTQQFEQESGGMPDSWLTGLKYLETYYVKEGDWAIAEALSRYDMENHPGIIRGISQSTVGEEIGEKYKKIWYQRLGSQIVEEFVGRMARREEGADFQAVLEEMGLSLEEELLFNSFTPEEWEFIEGRIQTKKRALVAEKAELERKREAAIAASLRQAGLWVAGIAALAAAGFSMRKGWGLAQWACAVAAALSLVSLWPGVLQWAWGGNPLYKLPYGYYTFLRLVVCLFCGWMGWGAWKRGANPFFVLAPALLAVLYQPFVKVELGTVVWQWVNAFSIPLLIVFATGCKKPDKPKGQGKRELETPTKPPAPTERPSRILPPVPSKEASDNEFGSFFRLGKHDIMKWWRLDVILCCMAFGALIDSDRLFRSSRWDIFLFCLLSYFVTLALYMLFPVVARLAYKGQSPRWVAVMCCIAAFSLSLSLHMAGGISLFGVRVGFFNLTGFLCVYKYARCCSLLSFVPGYMGKWFGVKM